MGRIRLKLYDKKRDMKAGTFFWLNKSLNEAFGAYDEQNIKLDTGTGTR